MRNLALILQYFVVACFGLVLPQPAWAFENYKVFKRDRIDFELSTDYFRSEANYPTNGGGQQSLPAGSSYSLTNFTFGSRYVPDRNWSVFAAANIGNAEALNSISTRTSSSLTWALFGADTLMYSGFVDVVPEFSLLAPFEEVQGTGDSALNSEGVWEGRGRLTVQKDWKKFRTLGYLGLTFRSGERSFLMPWGVGADVGLKKLRLGAELFGYQSISDDKDTGKDGLRLAYLNTVNGGSFAFYGVNPSLMDSNFFVRWSISPSWEVKAGAGMTLMGSYTAAGFHVGATLRYSLDLTAGYRPSKVDTYETIYSPVPKGRSNMYYDSGSLDNKSRLDDSYEEVHQEMYRLKSPTKKKAVKKVQKKKQKDVDFKIQLKSNKKKKR